MDLTNADSAKLLYPIEKYLKLWVIGGRLEKNEDCCRDSLNTFSCVVIPLKSLCIQKNCNVCLCIYILFFQMF